MDRQVGQRILSIDDKDISGKTKFEVADMIRGQEGTEVLIRVQPVLPYALAGTLLKLVQPHRLRRLPQVSGNKGNLRYCPCSRQDDHASDVERAVRLPFPHVFSAQQ